LFFYPRRVRFHVLPDCEGPNVSEAGFLLKFFLFFNRSGEDTPARGNRSPGEGFVAPALGFFRSGPSDFPLSPVFTAWSLSIFSPFFVPAQACWKKGTGGVEALIAVPPFAVPPPAASLHQPVVPPPKYTGWVHASPPVSESGRPRAIFSPLSVNFPSRHFF